MSYLLTFAPWIALAVASPLGGAAGACIAAVVGLAVVVQQRRRGLAADALILEIGSTAFLAALAALALVVPGGGIATWSAAASMLWLAALAAGSLALRRPFTLGIARRSVPREFWNKPGFVRVNVVITAVWAVAFALTAAAMALRVVLGGQEIVEIAIEVIGFVVPMIFTRRYPARVRARAAAQAGAPRPAVAV